MSKELSGKVIIVTGAGGCVGAEAVRVMSDQGAKVVALDLKEESTKDVVAEVNAKGGDAMSIGCNISDEVAVSQVAKKVLDKYGQVDVLFNNAGIVGNAKAILEMDKKGMEQVLDVNVVGTYVMSIEFGKIMKDQGKGRIINTASIAGVQAEYGASAYCVSKAAVEMMTQCLEIELGPVGVSAVAICPGPIKGPMLMDAYTDRAKVEGISLDAYFDKMTATIPGKRYAEAKDIADLAAFLAADKSYHIAGTHVISAGGLIIR